jgi:polar amino acid transport system substrate-binding protein
MGFLAATLSVVTAAPVLAGVTLDRVREAGKLTLGYRDDARPFSFKDESGAPAGFSIALCKKIAEDIKAELGLSELNVEWAPVTLEDRFDAVQQGRVDLLCGADTATLARRSDVSFSVPIYPSGIGAIVRADAAAALQAVLEGRPVTGPIWRGYPARILEEKTFAVVTGTTSETWLAERMAKFQLSATVLPVENYAAGVAAVTEGNADVFFGDRAIMMDAAAENVASGNLVALDRTFTNEPIALALARDNDDLRLVVDRTLSRLYASPEFRDLYATSFGEPGAGILLFYGVSALPE